MVRTSSDPSSPYYHPYSTFATDDYWMVDMTMDCCQAKDSEWFQMKV